MTIRVAVLIFVVSFAAITGWLVTREPADSDIAQTVPLPAKTAETPTPESEEENSKGNGILAISDEERGIKEVLNSMVIPLVDFQDETLEEALEFLRLKFKEIESTRISNLDFAIRKHPQAIDQPQGPSEWNSPKVTLHEENISMTDAIDRICKQTGHQWSIEGQTVVLTLLE